LSQILGAKAKQLDNVQLRLAQVTDAALDVVARVVKPGDPARDGISTCLAN
jgi:hypothetical protein